MSVVLCVAAGLTVGPIVRGKAVDDPPAVPRYTNDDLRRVSPLRDQTGVSSEPAEDAADSAPPPKRRRAGAGSPRGGAARGRDRGEDYWRREAERVDDRVRPMERQIEALQRKIETRRRLPEVRPYTDPQILDWRRQIDELRTEIRILRDRLDDRARREGAPPGWLR